MYNNYLKHGTIYQSVSDAICFIVLYKYYDHRFRLNLILNLISWTNCKIDALSMGHSITGQSYHWNVNEMIWDVFNSSLTEIYFDFR